MAKRPTPREKCFKKRQFICAQRETFDRFGALASKDLLDPLSFLLDPSSQTLLLQHCCNSRDKRSAQILVS